MSNLSNVRYWHLADIPAYVDLCLLSGAKQTSSATAEQVIRTCGDHSLYLLDEFLAVPDERPYGLPGSDCICRIVPVLPCVPVALGRAGGCSTVHPASTVWHRWSLARVPFACLRAASRTEVHGVSLSHGVVPSLFCLTPLPAERFRQWLGRPHGRAHARQSSSAVPYPCGG